MKNFLKQFREFAVKGNAIDLAVGVVIGTAFGKIVSSLVSDILNPLLGFFTGGVDFSKLSLHLPNPLPGGEDSILRYGLLIQSVFEFVLIALALFGLVKAINSMKRRFEREQKAGQAPKPADVVLLEEIRDLLKAKSS
jgi:large conductance mechanosensitive channel